MKQFYCSLVGLIFYICSVNATHNRAGEITYRQISAYTFEFTITTFTYTLSVVELNGGRTSLDISWGDKTSSSATRVSRIQLQDTYFHNTYTAIHTFPGPGVYEIVMQDPNRNYGVLNIPNSVNVIFSVKTTMIVNPQLGVNNTPELLNYPIDKAALGRIFIHNPAAYDADGDSLSYKIAICTKEKGIPIENYSFPRASDTLYVNPVTGDLVWDAPLDTGIFNIAMNVEEWRGRVKIGNIERDMQVEVYNSLNKPPINQAIKSLCVKAGTLIEFNITSTDADNDGVTQYAAGGPFVVTINKATFEVQSSAPGRTTSRFRWQTDCSHVRKQPYTVVIKSEDNYKKLKLVDLDNFNIKVLSPEPKSISTIPGNNSIIVKWSKSVCPQAIGYDIYRRTSGEEIKVDSCNGGIPAGYGYRKIAASRSINDTVYIDNNNGQNLSLGVEYCYRVVAVFDDGALSYPSEESCAILVSGTPALTSASVTKIDPLDGEVFVSWIRPRSLDTIPALGPYEYRIYRSATGSDNDTVLLQVRQSLDLQDTTYTDTLNTEQFPYYYKVKLFNNAPGNRFLIGRYETASTMYPDLYPSDNQITVRFAKNVPWVNNRYIIYRKNIQTQEFDSIGHTDTEEYFDKGLANGQIYSYRVKSYGYRQLKEVLYSTLNWSHINSATPLDTIKPCSPDLTVRTDCDSLVNNLTWTNPNHSCADDVVRYNIYYKPTISGDSVLLISIDNLNDTVFTHRMEGIPAGCYVVTAIDSFNNESLSTNQVCVDICSGYKLPNVFTPNNDDRNDIYVAKNPNDYVKHVDMKIFNRWGKLVFKTNVPAINWDGKDRETKQYVSTGVYYYVCDVYEPKITGTVEVKNLTGFIYVYYNKNGPESGTTVE